jgi:hypothetical protein
MIMMSLPSGASEYDFHQWTPEEQKAHNDYRKRMNDELVAASEYVEVVALTPPKAAKLVREGKNGAPVTDGEFPATKEFLAGFWIVEVDTAARAYEIAAEASAAPGPGGASLRMPIEVRQVMQA